MADKDSELRVVRQSRDVQRTVVEAALQPGVSVARMAQEHGINANLLRKSITKYLLEREKGISPAPQEPVAEHHETAPAAEVIDGVAIDLLGPCKAASPTRTSSAFVPVVSVPPALLPEGSALARAPIRARRSRASTRHVPGRSSLCVGTTTGTNTAA
ncbi:transposase [Burkholderia sp. JPY481]|uniref:transposase n=1 Tax=Paraburkholderia sp. EG304 TaxID=3237015 RepID=UPI00317725DB